MLGRMTSSQAASNKSLTTFVIVGLALGLLFSLASLVLAAGGHGSYIPATVFFPAAMLLAIALKTISTLALGLAGAQWPLYGVLISMAARKRRAVQVISALGAVHILLIAACFLLDRTGQFSPIN